MKRIIVFGMVLMMALTACGKSKEDITSDLSYEETDVAESQKDADAEDGTWARTPMVMVDDKLYFDTGKENTGNRRCGTPDGAITTTVDVTEIPTENNQSNFGTGFDYQYGAEDTIEICMDGKWMIFEYRTGDGSQVRFGEKMIDASNLSQETLEWLAWYNQLSKEEQMAISAIPEELRMENELTETADEQIAQH